MYKILNIGFDGCLLLLQKQVQKVSDYQNGSKEKYSKLLNFVIIMEPFEIEWTYKAVEVGYIRLHRLTKILYFVNLSFAKQLSLLVRANLGLEFNFYISFSRILAQRVALMTYLRVSSNLFFSLFLCSFELKPQTLTNWFVKMCSYSSF